MDILPDPRAHGLRSGKAMEPERKPLERPDPRLKPVEPEMQKGLDEDQHGRTPDTEPAKEKREDDL